MGWSNYIIINRLKLAVEISRYVNSLDSYEIDALDYLTGERDYLVDDIEETKVTDLTIKELSLLTTSYIKVDSLKELDVNKLLLYWLESRGIEYEIMSEHNAKISELEEKGFRVINMSYREDKKEVI